MINYASSICAPIRIHQIDALRRGEVQTNASCLKANEQDLATGVVFESFHSSSTLVALHSTVKPFVTYPG